MTVNIHQKISERYAGTEWALALEVADATGGCRRRCDALAMGLWKSKGLHLHGHEIKHSRSDWLAEINDPTKADMFAKRCHYWWICAPKGIVKLEELPATWGLMHATEKTSLRVAKPATKMEPEQVSWSFFASCMRAFGESTDLAKDKAREYSRGYNDAQEQLKKRYEDNRSIEQTRDAMELNRVKQSIADFEAASGISIKMFDGKKIGEAVKLAQQISGYESVANLAEKAHRAAGILTDLIDEMNAVAAE